MLLIQLQFYYTYIVVKVDQGSCLVNFTHSETALCKDEFSVKSLTLLESLPRSAKTIPNVYSPLAVPGYIQYCSCNSSK